MIGSRPCEIEVLFGSKNRADFDALSDVDYLIADSDPVRLSHRKTILEGFGFSVSDYTLRRLRTLFAKRTLFAAHLKLEGRVIFDQCHEFSALTECLDPLRDYSLEQSQALDLFSPLETIPDCPQGFMWALDHLSVAFRNAAIIDHARRGEFVFSQDGLIANYRKWGEASSDELEALRELRTAKRAYREGRSVHNARETVEKGILAVNNLLDLEIVPSFQSGVCYADLPGAESSTVAYVTLRKIERELISHGDLHRGQEADRVRNVLIRTVRNPHSYLWRIMYRPEAIERSLSRLRELSC